MIIITGATGQLGRLIVEDLLSRVPAEQLGVSRNTLYRRCKRSGIPAQRFRTEP